MSDTALKFGPEWLRALSHGDTAVSPPPSPSLGAPRYKLADHRYGREEMLALFDKMMKAPDDLVIAPPLYVEKTQLPLALVQMTDEEMRMWQRGVNSDVVLKLMGRSTGGGPSVASGGPPGPVAARGRGGSMDRGRGRGRGLGSAVGAYNRGTSYEEDVGEHGRREGGPPTGYGRGARPFERPQNPSERPWVERSERNGGSEEWNGSTSPRKEFGRPFADNNWRSRDAKERERGDSKEEEDGWRTAGRGERWGRSGWRNDREPEREGGTEKGERFFGKGERDGWEGQGSVQGQNQGGSERDRHRSWDSDNRPAAGGSGSSYYANKRSMQRRGWDDHDTLPEWAAEDMQGGGTFDASGAFRDERWSDEDDVGDERKRSGGGGDGQQNKGLLEEEADPSGTVEDQTNTHQVESVEVKDGGQAVSKEASVESHSDGTSSMTGEPTVASPGHSANGQLEDVRAAMDRESGLSMTSVDPVDHHGHRVCEEDGLEHAQAVASTLVAQLVEEEDHPKETLIPNHHIVGMEQWFYRDPQGEVQGPFTCAEMAEWFNSGYFTMALSVRRACDERFVQLGELTKLWGVRLPFLAGHNMPPLKSTDVNPMVAEQEKIHMIQQQLIQQQLFQQQLMQQQQMMMRQQSVVSKLSQMDGWNTLSPIQQQQLVNQHMLPPHATGIVGGDPLLQQLRIQMEAQAKLQAEILHRKDSVQSMVNMQQPQPQPPQPQQHPKAPESVLEPVAQMKQDPIQAFVQQLLGQPKGPNLSKSPQLPSKPVEMDPIQSLLQQAQWNAAQSGGPNVGNNVDSHTAHIAPGFHGMPPGPGLVPWPPHTLALGMGGLPMAPAMYSHAPTEPPTSVWDLENAANAEENKRMMEQQQQLAEMRRREEEEKRMMEEEERKRREREIQEREEERKRMEQMRREAEARQQAEEMRRRSELERQQMEEKRRREEEKRRKEEEMRQQQAEEERIRREEERIRKEEEKVAEQQRRQQEALQRLQEQQAAAQAQARAQAQAQQAAAAASAQQAQPKNQPSAVAPWAQQQQQQQQQQQSSESLSLAEIQKLQEEREMKEKAAAQAQKSEQAARAALLQQQQQQAASKLRWGKQTVSTAAKSLAEIQAEEAAQLARQKEKERVEKASQQVNLNLAAAGAWGASHSSSAWSSGRTAAAVVSQNLPPVNHVNSNWKTGSVGFWEDPTPPKPQPASSQPQQSPAPVSKPTPAAASAAPAAAAPSSSKGAQQQQQPKGTTNTAASVNKKNRNNKEDETVRKLFGQTTEKKDSFSQWCFEYLKKVQAPIDVPTFVCFLKDVESPFEVQDYVRSYLGEGKEAKEFAKQFLEQRSKLRQLQRSVQQYEEDNMCIPAKAVNPGQASDFHEVKSKSKKSKKKMQKVDASLLGFSVSASTDRINVGERDFVDGM